MVDVTVPSDVIVPSDVFVPGALFCFVGFLTGCNLVSMSDGRCIENLS